jgi:glycosyltransferase involved in cell wall biosynthesis
VHIALEPYLRIVAPRARRWVRWAYPRLTAAICPSEGAARSLRSVTALPVERIHVVPNLFDAARIEHMAADALPEWAAEVMAKPTVVGIGRLVPHKGFDVLIRAHARLRASGIDHHVLILGEGPQRDDLEALVKDLSVRASVFMPGFVPNPYPFLARAAVFTLASRLEGMPLVLIEAMALGIPIVATDCESGPAEMLDRGRYGLLVPPGDEDALAGGIARLLGDAAVRASFAADARERVRSYGAERVIPQWQGLLERLART